MTSIVDEASISCDVASLSLQETGSRNKRKFSADPLISDSCDVLSLARSVSQGYEFSADRYEVNALVHGEGGGCDMCGVNEDHSDGLKLELGLPSVAGFAGTGHPREEGEGEEVYGVNWSDLTEPQLEELLLANLDVIFRSAIKRIISNGYTEEFATGAVLKSGLCYGNKDTVSNIVDNVLAYLKKGQEVDTSKEPCFEDLQQLVRYVLVELVCILREVRPSFSIGEAMWCLLLCDMHVTHACSLDSDSLSSFMKGGVSSTTLATSTQPEVTPEAATTDAKPPAPSKPTPAVASTLGTQLGKESVAGKESTTTVSLSVDKPFKATASRQTTSEDKSVLSRKVPSNSAKRESILRQKSCHLEKNHRMHDTKAATRAAKMSGFEGLILDRKLRESAAAIKLKKASLRLKAMGAMESEASVSHPNATLSLSTTHVIKSPLPSSNHDKLATLPPSTETDKPPAVTSQPVLSDADTELSLSLSPPTELSLSQPTQSNPPSSTLSSNPDALNISDMLGKWVPQDKKDDMIVKLYPRLQELQAQLHEWTEWANGKVMQAARRLGKDRAELKMLREEKEEIERLKKEKQALQESTMKKLSELENALSKASDQVGRANCAVRQLDRENKRSRQEMEAAKLQAIETASNCEDAKIREKQNVTTIQSWEKQKSALQEKLAVERRKLSQLQSEVKQASGQQLQLEARWKQEEKEKNEILAQAHAITREREELEALAKSKEDTVKAKAEASLLKYMNDIRELEKEISVLRLETDSSKIAAMRRGVDESYGNSFSDTKTKHAPESQSPPVNSVSYYSSSGGVKRDRECVMCLSEEMSVVFLPCAHQVVCTTCNELHEKQGMKDCPSCRSTIQRRICVRYASP